MRMGLNLVHLFGHLSWPVMPTAARAIHDAIQHGAGRHSLAERTDGGIPGPARTRPDDQSPDVLFAKITDEQIAEWQVQFGGTGTP